MNDRTFSMLLTDLYELTMSAAFHELDFNPTASFELFVRRLPKHRGYLIAAGLEQALEWLESARFETDEIEFLRRHAAFQHVPDAFFDRLHRLRFTGEVWAVPEGTAIFPEEPIVRVTAPLIEAQIVETFLLAAITFQTSVATKATRVIQAAGNREVIEFGARRAHGPEASILAARAAYIGGCIGTSNVEAGYRFGIPTFGTIAHSYVMALGDEPEAFKQYVKLFPENSTLLVDTYDTLAAVDGIIGAGLRPAAVRLDSGDLVSLSQQVRRKFDEAGLRSTRVFASGDLEEHKITDLLNRGAAIDGFGVGTSLVVSDDAPALGGIYKLVELERDGQHSYHAKFSNSKMTHPGKKQVYRFRTPEGQFSHDIIACSGERVHGGEALLQPVMRVGKRLIDPSESLQNIRERVRSQMDQVPTAVRRLVDPGKYDVRFSAEQERILAEVRKQHRAA
jgi:nicotinate phosphoribosyltransferase